MTKKSKILIGTTATVVITAGVAFALYLLFRLTETRITTTGNETKTTALVCQAMAAADEDFFNPSGAHNFKQKIKITFMGSRPDKLNYIYEGTYGSAAEASKANDNLHADYNNYMGINAEDLNPVFSTIDNILKISLFTNKNQINNKAGRMFYLSNVEVSNFAEYTDTDLKEMYQKKGFSCELES